VPVGEGKGNVRHRPVLVLADLKDSGGERIVLVPRQLSNLCHSVSASASIKRALTSLMRLPLASSMCTPYFAPCLLIRYLAGAPSQEASPAIATLPCITVRKSFATRKAPNSTGAEPRLWLA
jgi:hypothetical protein